MIVSGIAFSITDHAMDVEKVKSFVEKMLTLDEDFRFSENILIFSCDLICMAEGSSGRRRLCSNLQCRTADCSRRIPLGSRAV